MRRGPKNLRITFDADALTHYGGAVLVHQFVQRIGLRSQLAWSVWFRQRNNRYQISETVLAVLYPVILGMERLGITESLRHNGVFQYLTGLPGYPDLWLPSHHSNTTTSGPYAQDDWRPSPWLKSTKLPYKCS